MRDEAAETPDQNSRPLSPPGRRHGIVGRAALGALVAISKWYAVVYLVLVYLYWQSYECTGAQGRTTTLSEVLARLREEHQRAVLRAACEEAANGTPVEQVLARYLGSAKTPAA